MSLPANEIVYDDDFVKDVRKLPAESQRKLAELLVVLREDPFDPRTHTKPLNNPLRGMFSFRITRDYRVGFIFKAPHVIRLLVADRRDRIYEQLLRKI